MNEYIDRFGEKRSVQKGLRFDVQFGDLIMLNGRYQLVTGYGIYDNQVWTEKIFEDGCHLGSGNYELATGAVVISDKALRTWAIEAYKAELRDCLKMFFSVYSKQYVAMIEAHLEQLTV